MSLLSLGHCQTEAVDSAGGPRTGTLAALGWEWGKQQQPKGTEKPWVPVPAFRPHLRVLSTYLVIHEGQERRNNQRETGASPGIEHRRKLVTQGFTSTSGQHQQRGHAWVGSTLAGLPCGPVSAPP